MNHLTSLTLVDLVAALVVVLLVVGAVRRGAGLLAALAAGASGLVGLWLLAVLAVGFAPTAVAAPVGHSALVTAVPYPQHAVDQARALVDGDHAARP